SRSVSRARPQHRGGRADGRFSRPCSATPPCPVLPALADTGPTPRRPASTAGRGAAPIRIHSRFRPRTAWFPGSGAAAGGAWRVVSWSGPPRGQLGTLVFLLESGGGLGRYAGKIFYPPGDVSSRTVGGWCTVVRRPPSHCPALASVIVNRGV